MKLIRFAMAAVLLSAIVGCGAPKPAATAKADTTAACCDSGTCTSCSGSDSTGAVCDTVLDTTAAAGTPAAPAPVKPESRPKPVAEKTKELPRMWDFGSEQCNPCKTMMAILTPMMKDYDGKVDIRIIDVYKEKELTKQFKIVSIPTQVFIDAAGKELYRHIGVYPRESIEDCFKKFDFPIVAGSSTPTQPPATGST